MMRFLMDDIIRRHFFAEGFATTYTQALAIDEAHLLAYQKMYTKATAFGMLFDQ
jgi:hypothetical protein